MNISDKNKEKLRKIKKDFYAEIKEKIEDKIEEDGSIFIKLDKVEKDFTYFYKSSDFIKITKKDNTITISDNFDKESEEKESEHNFNLTKCKKKIEYTIMFEIEKYNKNNKLIKEL